jgi:hypothetical protein
MAAVTVVTVDRKTYRISSEDVELARLIHQDHPHLDRGKLGVLLEKQGLAKGHHRFSGCPDQVLYLNLILDTILPE